MASFYRSSASFCQVSACEVWQYRVLLQSPSEGCGGSYSFIHCCLSAVGIKEEKSLVVKVHFLLRLVMLWKPSRAGADVCLKHQEQDGCGAAKGTQGLGSTFLGQMSLVWLLAISTHIEHKLRSVAQKWVCIFQKYSKALRPISRKV